MAPAQPIVASSPFTAREPWTCYICGLNEPKGVPVRWVRSGPDQGKRYHPACTPVAAPTAPYQTTTTPGAPATPVAGNDVMAGLAGLIAPYMQGALQGKVNADDVSAIVQTMIDEQFPLMAQAITNTLRNEFVHKHVIELRNPITHEIKDLGVQHKEFPILLDAMQATIPEGESHRHLNIWLTGPTGSGKTTSAKLAAKALGMNFGFCGALDSEYKLLGFINANGVVVDTEFKRMFTQGGVFLLDEVDSWLPGAALALNAALANSECAFPEGTLPRHPDFICIAAANTWGMGAADGYVGRNKLDAAFLGRFATKIDWYYDTDLEMALSGNPAWCKRVQALRANAKKQGLQVIIHPRYTIEGAALLALGWDMAKVERYTIAPGLKTEQWEQIR